MRLACSIALLALPALMVPACVDKSLPDLSRELGEGRTDGPFCSPTEIDFFPPEEMRVHLIDVGQGDAIWVQTPYYDDRELESRNIIMDAGPPENGYVVVDYLLAHGVVPGGIIHAFVLSHAHADHYGGLDAITSVFDVLNYVDPGYDGSAGYQNARAAAEGDVHALNGNVFRPAVPQLTPRLYTPTSLFGEYVDATLIASSATKIGNDDGTGINNTSVAFAIRWTLNQVLLTGDMEEAIENQLITAHDAGEINLQSRVLKVAHHGSNTSSTRQFLGRVFPAAGPDEWAVISSGRTKFGGVTLPREDTLLRLSEVLEPNHILSTENRDDIKDAGTEEGDDHIIVRLKADGSVEACYAQ